MTIRKKLSKELDHLVSMMPLWQRWEKLQHATFMNSQAPADFVEYSKAHWRVVYMMEKVEFITELLGYNE